MTIYEKLLNVQVELKVPKSQYNKFGNYNYRNCEDILEAAKPILLKNKAAVCLTDEIVQIGERYYVKATAHFIDVTSGEKLETCAYAREEDTKKGMDGSQITGSSSSYARKYALNGLFDIDDTKDSDIQNESNSSNDIGWRKEFINCCKAKGIESVEYAKKHGINKQTTQEEYKKIVEELNSDTNNNVVSMDEI